MDVQKVEQVLKQAINGSGKVRITMFGKSISGVVSLTVLIGYGKVAVEKQVWEMLMNVLDSDNWARDSNCTFNITLSKYMNVTDFAYQMSGYFENIEAVG